MAKGQRESQWKVGPLLIMVVTTLIFLVSQGDVSLSAEDKPLPFSANRPPAETTTLSVNYVSPGVGVDNEFEDCSEEEREHHGWLDGHAAIKFLTAGGIAGAGE